ncbi:TPA: hypothetical protein ACKMTL_000234 [Neisseria gonorrhoeae]
MPSERRQIAAGRSFGAFRRISRGIVVEKTARGKSERGRRIEKYKKPNLFLKNIDIIYIYSDNIFYK